MASLDKRWSACLTQYTLPDIPKCLNRIKVPLFFNLKPCEHVVKLYLFLVKSLSKRVGSLSLPKCINRILGPLVFNLEPHVNVIKLYLLVSDITFKKARVFVLHACQNIHSPRIVLPLKFL